MQYLSPRYCSVLQMLRTLSAILWPAKGYSSSKAFQLMPPAAPAAPLLLLLAILSATSLPDDLSRLFVMIDPLLEVDSNSSRTLASFFPPFNMARKFSCVICLTSVRFIVVSATNEIKKDEITDFVLSLQHISALNKLTFFILWVLCTFLICSVLLRFSYRIE